MSSLLEVLLVPAVAFTMLAIDGYIKAKREVDETEDLGPLIEEDRADLEMKSAPKFTYDEESGFDIIDALNKRDYEILNHCILPMNKDSINSFGLSFLSDVDEDVLRDKKLLALLRELMGTKPDESVTLYIGRETEKRVFDDYDYDYVYRDYYIILTSDDRFVRFFADVDYSQTFEGD